MRPCHQTIGPHPFKELATRGHDIKLNIDCGTNIPTMTDARESRWKEKEKNGPSSVKQSIVVDVVVMKITGKIRRTKKQLEENGYHFFDPDMVGILANLLEKLIQLYKCKSSKEMRRTIVSNY